MKAVPVEGFVSINEEVIPVRKTVFSWGTRLVRRSGVLGEWLREESRVLNANPKRAFMLKASGRVDLRPKKESVTND